MKILAVSDSHHDTSFLLPALRRFAGEVDLIAHMGDGVADVKAAARQARMKLPRVVGVRGNGDHDPAFWPRLLVGNSARPVLLLHGHLDGVGEGLAKAMVKAEEAGAKLLLFGHTHRAFSEVNRGILVLNPGSISRPRGRDHPTFAVIDVPEDLDVWFTVQFYEVGPEVGVIREIEVV
jgi:putative phosphoesterase